MYIGRRNYFAEFVKTKFTFILAYYILITFEAPVGIRRAWPSCSCCPLDKYVYTVVEGADKRRKRRPEQNVRVCAKGKKIAHRKIAIQPSRAKPMAVMVN